MTYTKNKYALPVKKKKVTHTMSDPRAHWGHTKHSIDFVMPEGTKIYAPKTGTVIDVKQDSKEGGLALKYANPKYTNHITIQHSNREYSQYVHIKHKGSLVKVGDKVRQGQAIALSGNTGMSSAPHLHFHILKLANTKEGWETLKPRFKERIKVNRETKPIPKSQEKKLKKLIEKVKKSYGK